MSNLERRKWSQRLQEAEGYLDLLLSMANRCTPELAHRRQIVQRALDALAPLHQTGWRRAQVLFLEGQAHRLLEDYPRALAALKQAADLEPENVQIHLACAWCYKRLKRLDLAIEMLETALAIDAERAIIFYNLACYWSLAKNTKLAVQYLATAFELDSHYREMVDSESDFDPIRRDPDFVMLTSVVV